jgi:hypothetical protein
VVVDSHNSPVAAALVIVHGDHHRERPSFVEAEIRGNGEAVRMEWARDSAYRFFPLIHHEELGLVLHPFDLATNKVRIPPA